MTEEHTLKGKITSGRVEAEHSDGPENLAWELRDLRFGTWECSCGMTFPNEREAAIHLRSVETDTYHTEETDD